MSTLYPYTDPFFLLNLSKSYEKQQDFSVLEVTAIVTTLFLFFRAALTDVSYAVPYCILNEIIK